MRSQETQISQHDFKNNKIKIFIPNHDQIKLINSHGEINEDTCPR